MSVATRRSVCTQAHSVFRRIDADHSGYIDCMELHNSLSDYGLAEEAIERVSMIVTGVGTGTHPSA